MKNKLLLIMVAIVALIYFPKSIFGQAPALGTTADFVLFTTVGAVSNTGVTHLTGNVGSNSGSSTGFGNVNGDMDDGNPASAQAAVDIVIAYNQLNATIPTFFPAPLLGNGQILNAGVYSIAAPATLNLDLTLDGQGNPAAVFIIQIGGAFSTAANSEVKLVNGALACNVFWQVEGLVDMAAGTTMKGTIIANNAAINMNSGTSLEGRALAISGAITLDGVLAYTPIGCGSPLLTGPIAPDLGTSACFAIFSSDGPVTNVGVTNLVGDVGTNLGLTLGFNPLTVTGTVHPIPDGFTVQAATDLMAAYTYLNALPFDIELLYPAQFGNSLVLTPHTYIMNGAVTFTDTVFLDGENNAAAVFVIQVKGAFSTSTFSKVKLIRGTQAKNVYWMVDGAVDLNDFSEFEGTIVCNNGAMNINTGVMLNGRALTTTGALATAAITAVIPSTCNPSVTTEPTDQTACVGTSVSFTIVETGINLTYQWRLGNVDLVDGGSISGVNTPTLTINPVTNGDAALNYNVVIIGDYAPNDTSNNVSLTVNKAPNITTEPSSQTACAGSSASFDVIATGTGLNYQWRIGLVDLIDGGNISGATTSTLTINPVGPSDVALDYNVLVTGTCLPDATSIDAALALKNAPNIVTEPTDQVVCAGNSVSFDVVATGNGLNYQWRKGLVDMLDGGSVSGATTATLTINPANISDVAANYNVVVSGTCLPDATSVNVSLTIDVPPLIVTEPTDQTVCVGGSVSFDVVAAGSGLNYQWRRGLVDMLDGGSVSGATTATLTINPASILDAALDYNVVITGTCLPSTTSINVSLTVNELPTIITEPIDQTVCAGSSVSFAVVATGTGINYQWRKGLVDMLDGGSVSGATTATLTINPVSVSDGAGNYNVLITGTCLPDATSVNVSLTVNSAPTIINQPTDQTACEGSSVSFTVVASGAGLNYQWRKGLVDILDGGSVSGATTATLTINPASVADNAGNYNVLITGTCLPTATSVDVSLTVNPLPVAVATSNSPVCTTGSIDLNATTVAGATYQWTGPNAFSSPNQHAVILSPTAVNSGTYSLVVLLNGCSSLPSTVAVSVVNCPSDLSIIKTASNMKPFVGTELTFTVVVTNNGTSDATGVAVTDVLQNGYTFVSSSATAGIYDVATGVWTIGTLLDGTSETLTLTVTVNATGNYVNTAIVYGNETDNNMVNNSSSIEPIPTDFNIPEGFSPNGDGVNDLFVIRGIDHYPSNTFLIFNRWGDKVLDTDNYNNTWDGTNTLGIRVGGDVLPVGTYFYILDLGDGTPVYKGTIYLNR